MSGDIYLSVSISIDSPVWKIVWGEFFVILMIISVKSPVASGIFWIALFEAVSSAPVVDF